MEPELTRRRILQIGLASLAGAMTGCYRQTGRRRQPTAPISGASSPRAAPVAPVETAGIWYTVVPGDTLSKISRRSRAPVSEIVAANNLRGNLIRPGQRLWLPDATVLRDDPLAAAAARAREPATAGSLAAGSFRLVNRRAWTTASVRSNHRKMGRVTRLTIHHTGEHAGMAGLADVEIVRRIERYHRDQRKWAAIGYHYLVGRDGRIYEGRPATIQGAHTSGGNRNNLGISCIGDYHLKRPDARQLGALAAFLSDRCRHYSIGRDRVFGHRDISPSICPGDALYAWLQRWKQAG